MMENRGRHYKDMMEKIKMYNEKAVLIELQRMKNQIDKKKLKHAISFNR